MRAVTPPTLDSLPVTDSYKTHPDCSNISQVTSSELTHGGKMVSEGGMSPLQFHEFVSLIVELEIK